MGRRDALPRQGRSDAGFYIGSGLFTWAFWVLSSVAGQVIGGGIPDPQRFAIDLVVPAFFFVAMLVPNWKGRREGGGLGRGGGGVG